MSGTPYLACRPTTLFVLLKDMEYTASAPKWCTAVFKIRIFHYFSKSFKCSCLIVVVVYDCFNFLRFVILC